MNKQSPEMLRLLAQDPALAVKVAAWELAGLCVRYELLRVRLLLARGAL